MLKNNFQKTRSPHKQLVILIFVLLIFFSACETIEVVTPTESALEIAIGDALGHLSGGPFRTNTPSTSMLTIASNVASNNAVLLHYANIVTNMSSNIGYLWFTLDNDAVDTVVVQNNQERVSVLVSSSNGGNANIETNGMRHGFFYQVLEASSGPWYLKIQSSNNMTNSVVIAIARAEDEHNH